VDPAPIISKIKNGNVGIHKPTILYEARETSSARYY